MKPSYALPFALLLAMPGWAQTPAGQSAVVLLDDFKIIEGVVDRSGTDYVVRKGKDTRRIPEKQVLFVGESATAVQEYLRSRAAVTNPVLGNEAVRWFNQKVQPVLSNSCANCHARADHPSEFKLARVTEGYANPEAQQRNAMATAVFVTANPATSPLLVKALTAHGGQREPGIRGRDHPAYRNLEQWARLSAPPAKQHVAVAQPKPVAAKPSDPFDPAIFNRVAHPDR